MNAPAARGNNSTTMASMIDFEVQNILKEGYAMARGLLSTHYEQLKKLADALMEREQLDRKQFEALVQG
jgi:cell division protease FtsH